MNPIRKTLLLRKAEQQGSEDAERQLHPDADTFVNAYLTKSVEYLPGENPVQRDVEIAVATTHEVEQLRVEIDELDVQAAEHPSPLFLLFAIIVLVLMDVQVNIQFFKQDGYQGFPLLLMSAALAVVLFTLTFQLAKRSGEQS